MGTIYWPPSAVPLQTLILSFVVWQMGTFGITIGYHRLYSHRAFRASLGVRMMLAAMGSSAFQGSIKPGGASLLRKYSTFPEKDKCLDASWAFGGGLNNHSRAAKRQMRALRVAKIQRDD
ncbi:hypothetical protein H0H81_003725 [Sphagnurus paluster]|uniref:Uncharacterized protein n=1 Tax=Sphagnurus paluster TaxID=117069 RepID=A0A9P7K5F7_9AGAR|nr:hypothetical protein H0H81_003725 [Sphagnurus paluster]